MGGPSGREKATVEKSSLRQVLVSSLQRHLALDVTQSPPKHARLTVGRSLTGGTCVQNEAKHVSLVGCHG